MTKRELQQVYALTRLPGWALLRAEFTARALTRLKQQCDKTGESLAQASGRSVEAAWVSEILEGYENPGKDKDAEQED